MKKNLEILKSVILFKEMDEEEILALLPCLASKTSHYEKGQTIFFSGESIDHFGIVLSGQVQVVYDDYYGNRNILANIGMGNLVGESFACAEIKTLPVSVIAASECDMLFIDCRKLAAPCEKACAFHNKLIQNMLSIVSMKNIYLTQKIEFTAKRTTREKLLSYLSAEAQKAGSNHFIIPFDRQELADFLSVDRSAMSAELSKLKSDGVLDYKKSSFELL